MTDGDIPPVFLLGLHLVHGAANSTDDIATIRDQVVKAAADARKLRERILHAAACQIPQHCTVRSCSVLRRHYHNSVIARENGNDGGVPQNLMRFIHLTLDDHCRRCNVSCDIRCCRDAKVNHVAVERYVCECDLCKHTQECGSGSATCWQCSIVESSYAERATLEANITGRIGFANFVLSADMIRMERIPHGCLQRMNDQNFVGFNDALAEYRASEGAPAEVVDVDLRITSGIAKPLGTGSFGKVYKIPSSARGLWLAVKQVSIWSSERRRTEDTIREIYALMTLPHPSIVKPYGASSVMDADDPKINIFMELMWGSLKKFVEDHSVRSETASLGLPREHRLHILKLLLSALSYVHSQGIIHMDIKWENILVDIYGSTVKLTDFNLSVYKRLDHDAVAIGSGPFLAPEIGTGRINDYPVDVGSVGLCAVAMLTSQMPRNFIRLSRRELRKLDHWIREIAEYGRPHPLPLFSHLSSAEKELYQSMLSVAPEDRPTAQEALDRLQDPSYTPRLPLNQGRGVDFFLRKTENSPVKDVWLYSLAGLPPTVNSMERLKRCLDKSYRHWRTWGNAETIEIFSYDVERCSFVNDKERDISNDVAFLIFKSGHHPPDVNMPS